MENGFPPQGFIGSYISPPPQLHTLLILDKAVNGQLLCIATPECTIVSTDATC